jgi:hypothetical protein
MRLTCWWLRGLVLVACPSNILDWTWTVTWMRISFAALQWCRIAACICYCQYAGYNAQWDCVLGLLTLNVDTVMFGLLWQNSALVFQYDGDLWTQYVSRRQACMHLTVTHLMRWPKLSGRRYNLCKKGSSTFCVYYMLDILWAHRKSLNRRDIRLHTSCI